MKKSEFEMLKRIYEHASIQAIISKNYDDFEELHAQCVMATARFSAEIENNLEDFFNDWKDEFTEQNNNLRDKFKNELNKIELGSPNLQVER